MKMTMFRSAMRVGAVALCSAALCAVPMMAQGGGGGGRGGMMRMTSDQRVDALDKAVTLTADQKTKIKAIYDADMKKMMDLRNSGGDPQDMRPKMMAIRTDENNQIKALLTDEQKPKFDAFVASQMQGRGPGGGPGGAPGGAGAPPPAAPPQ
jgi:Spy/CpxP family protein refolding chaperone